MAVFTGTAGDDSILGTSGDDDFHLEQGGADSASGGAGVDVFYMGGTLGAGDQIDGGGGNDVLVLDGDYGAGVTFTPAMMSGMERILLEEGHSYTLKALTDANLGKQLKIEGSTLLAGDNLKVDASGVSIDVDIAAGLGDDSLVGGGGDDTLDGGGAGRDTLVGGAGFDTFYMGTGVDVVVGGGGDSDIYAIGDGAFSARDKIDGGGGDGSHLTIEGDYAAPLVMRDSTLHNLDGIFIRNTGHIFDLTLADGLVAAGGRTDITGEGGIGVRIDASAETDGSYQLVGSSAGHNTLIGSAGDDFLFSAGGAQDTLSGGLGADRIEGYEGNDKLVGGFGADDLSGGNGADSFFYLDVQDSTAAAPDTIDDLEAQDVIYLKAIDADTKKAGNQAFHLVSAFTGHRGELVVHQDDARHTTTISGDIDGDGQADLVIDAAGNHGGFTNFVL